MEVGSIQSIFLEGAQTNMQAVNQAAEAIAQGPDIPVIDMAMMIEAQNAFEANVIGIKTADEMTEAILSMF